MVKETIICDNCDKIKEETNHWWSIALPNKLINNNYVITISPIINKGGLLSKDFCGEKCLFEELSKQLHGITDYLKQLGDNK